MSPSEVHGRASTHKLRDDERRVTRASSLTYCGRNWPTNGYPYRRVPTSRVSPPEVIERNTSTSTSSRC